MRRGTLVDKKRQTLDDLAKSGCGCSVCSSQDVVDNFNQVGKRNFTQLALSALEASKQVDNSIDK